MNQREFGILKEKLEILAGERGAPARFALRRGDLARLPELASREVSGAPTASDFNALRKDLEMIRQALVALGENGLRGRSCAGALVRLLLQWGMFGINGP